MSALAARPGRRHATGVLAALLAVGLTACAPGTSPGPGAQQIPPVADPAFGAGPGTKADAHAALARRLRPLLVERGPPPRTPLAADDERFRLGAFWRARTDTHLVGTEFQTHARAALALPGDTGSDAALRALLDVVEARLDDWQSLVDYNASGRMADDGGEGGRARLPGAIAALDAIEGAALVYIETVTASIASADATSR